MGERELKVVVDRIVVDAGDVKLDIIDLRENKSFSRRRKRRKRYGVFSCLPTPSSAPE